jgi:hypothetical protein
LNSLRLHVADVLIVVSERDLASIAEQLVHSIDRAADDALD